jgi:hypothetical protein
MFAARPGRSPLVPDAAASRSPVTKTRARSTPSPMWPRPTAASPAEQPGSARERVRAQGRGGQPAGAPVLAPVPDAEARPALPRCRRLRPGCGPGRRPSAAPRAERPTPPRSKAPTRVSDVSYQPPYSCQQPRCQPAARICAECRKAHPFACPPASAARPDFLTLFEGDR